MLEKITEKIMDKIQHTDNSTKNIVTHKDSHNTTSHSHNSNTDNSTHNNITVYGYPLPIRSDGTPVQLNSYHAPNLDYMPQEVSILLPLAGNHLAKTIEKIYFNPLHPENHTIGHYNQKENTCKVYTSDGFEIEKIDNITIVIIRHLKSIYDSSKKLVEMDPEIKQTLEKIFDTIGKAVRPQNEFYDIRDAISIKTKKYDNDGIPKIEINPDEIPPPNDSIEYELWHLDRVKEEITTRLEDFIGTVTTDINSDQEWNMKMTRGLIYQLVLLRAEMEKAGTAANAHKLSEKIDTIKSSADNCIKLLIAG